MATISKLEEAASRLNSECEALNKQFQEKFGAAYETVVQWRINKVMRRLKAGEDGSQRTDGRDKKAKRKREPKGESEPTLPGIAPSAGATMDDRGKDSSKVCPGLD